MFTFYFFRVHPFFVHIVPTSSGVIFETNGASLCASSLMTVTALTDSLSGNIERIDTIRPERASKSIPRSKCGLCYCCCTRSAFTYNRWTGPHFFSLLSYNLGIFVFKSIRHFSLHVFQLAKSHFQFVQSFNSGNC